MPRKDEMPQKIIAEETKEFTNDEVKETVYDAEPEIAEYDNAHTGEETNQFTNEEAEEAIQDAEPDIAEHDETNEAEDKNSEKIASRRELLAHKKENEEKRAKKNLKRETTLMAWEQLKSARHEKSVLTSRVIAVDILNNVMVAVVMKVKGFRIIIPCEELFVKPPVDMSTVTSNETRVKREKQMLTKLLGAEIPFIIKEIQGSPNSEYAVIASRKDAIQRMASHNFNLKNGYSRINEDDLVEATILSVGNHAVFVNVQGIDISIPIHQLTYRFVPNAIEAFSPGQKINVVVKNIERDEKGHVTEIFVSGKTAEIPDFISRIDEAKEGMNVLGRITSIRQRRSANGTPQNGTIVRLFLEELELPAIAIYTKIDTLVNPPRTGDLVVFSIHSKREDWGLCIGNIIRRV